MLFYNLPKIIDEEDNNITVVPVDIPSFEILGLSLTFAPNSLIDIADHLFTFYLTDNVTKGLHSKPFSFLITVIN